jgi:hybrid cluster-associated redox disulfide protein
MDAAPTVHTTIAELIDEWPAARAVLARRGMACVGCAMARFETIKEAARTYGFEAAQLITDVCREDGGVRSRVRPAGTRDIAPSRRSATCRPTMVRMTCRRPRS